MNITKSYEWGTLPTVLGTVFLFTGDLLRTLVLASISTSFGDNDRHGEMQSLPSKRASSRVFLSITPVSGEAHENLKRNPWEEQE